MIATTGEAKKVKSATTMEVEVEEIKAEVGGVENGAEEVHQIYDGPSREALFDALRLAYDKIRPTVELTVENGMLVGEEGAQAWCSSKILFKVIGLEHEDGSGTSFNFEGYIVPVPGWIKEPSELIHGYFNTRTRKGTLCAPAETIRDFGLYV